jgi:hypothetical protein
MMGVVSGKVNRFDADNRNNRVDHWHHHGLDIPGGLCGEGFWLGPGRRGRHISAGSEVFIAWKYPGPNGTV